MFYAEAAQQASPFPPPSLHEELLPRSGLAAIWSEGRKIDHPALIRWFFAFAPNCVRKKLFVWERLLRWLSSTQKEYLFT